MDRLFTPPIKRKAKRAVRPKTTEHTLRFGEEDEMDILSYAGLEEQADHIIIDGQYMRTLFVSGYPFVASSGWLNSLVNFNHNADISYHITQVEAVQALPKLHRKITELESTKRAYIRSGKIIGPEITDPHDAARQDSARPGEALPNVGLCHTNR